MSDDHAGRQNASETPTVAFSDFRPTIICNDDGTFTRFSQPPITPATPDPHGAAPVLTKDLSINTTNQTWLRIFLPRQALITKKLLPLIVYYHGGGFVFFSAASNIHHSFCERLAVEIASVVVSVEYRLAPEHRLPAAYEDGVEALKMIGCSQDEWLSDFADFSNCFLMGCSAGGNMAYHVGLRLARAVDDLEPLKIKIKGLILHHPFFGGSERTESELRMAQDPVIPLSASDMLWELSLPVGADRNHEYCNPTAEGRADETELIRAAGWRVLVAGCYRDPMIDRQMELEKVLRERGVRTVAHFSDGSHGVEFFDPSKAEELFSVCKQFICWKTE